MGLKIASFLLRDIDDARAELSFALLVLAVVCLVRKQGAAVILEQRRLPTVALLDIETQHGFEGPSERIRIVL